MVKENVVIVGAGRHGTEVYAYLLDLITNGAALNCLGFIDDHKPVGDGSGVPVLGKIGDLPALQRQYGGILHYITATGNNEFRQKMVKTIMDLGVAEIQPWTLRHQQTFVGQGVVVGAGTLLAPGSIITTNTTIGEHVILNIKVSVSHDCQIGNFVNLNPGVTICGDVQVGDGCYIGAGATIKDKVSLGAGTIVGAGAVVIKNIPARVTAVGVPTRIVKQW